MNRFALVILALHLAPASAFASADLLLPLRLTPPVLLADAEAQPAPAAAQPQAQPQPQPAAAPNLEFDLLGTPAKAPPAATAAQPDVDERAVATRRSMLKVHQGLGIGLMVLQLANVTLGQINYRDLFGGGDRTGAFKRAHQATAYTTFGLFVTNELIALLAPDPLQTKSQGVDRVLIHKIAMFTAMAGMLAEMVMGIATAELAGKVDQRDFAKAHLFIGYGTFAFMAAGVSALVF